MSIHKKKTGSNGLPLRNAAEFYIIALPAEYLLTAVTLVNCMDKKSLQQAKTIYPAIKLLSFTNGIAAFENKIDKTTFILSIKVAPSTLEVACSCDTAVESICIHAFKAMDRLVYYDEPRNLKRFMPGGAAEIVVENRRYFETKPGLSNMFKPRPTLGSVYGIKEPLADHRIEDVLSLPAAPSGKAVVKENSMCYIMMYSRRNPLLPFLLPCMGKLNKAGNTIKSFGNYLSGIQKEYDAMLTAEQRELNCICLELYKQVEKLSHELIQEDMNYNETSGLCTVFTLWKIAIPLLVKQHCYLHPYFQKRQLKGKPFHNWMVKINIQETVPSIGFKLTDKGAFYQLEMKPVINGKTINEFEMPDTFFMMEKQHVYMLASVRDAAVAEWMMKSKNRITIFKKHFAQFESSFLKPVEKYYTVKR